MDSDGREPVIRAADPAADGAGGSQALAELRRSAARHAVDLATRYMGLPLKNPLIASASPLTGDLGKIRRLEDAGAAAVVLPSIFEEQIDQEVRDYAGLAEAALDNFPEVPPVFPEPALYKLAATWSDGTSRELKNYGLACEAHRDSQLARAQIHSQGVALAEGETVGKVGVYRLKTGVRDVALVRLADH